MSNADRLIDDIDKQGNTADRVRAFVSGVKHQVADALSGARLPAENEARLASIFPDLEGSADRIAAAIDGKPEKEDVGPDNDAKLPPDSNDPTAASTQPTGAPRT